MRFLKKPIKILPLVIIIQACSSPFYGYSKRDWDRLSAEQQNAIQEEYQAIVDLKQTQAHTDALDSRTQSIIDYGVGGPKHGKPW